MIMKVYFVTLCDIHTYKHIIFYVEYFSRPAYGTFNNSQE
jgi:hypothetical protein